MLGWCLGGFRGVAGFNSEEVGVGLGRKVGLEFSSQLGLSPEAEEMAGPPVCCRCNVG